MALQLAGRKYGFEHRGAQGTLPVICLAGLTRNASRLPRPGDAISPMMGLRPRPVLALDYRGRGMSARDRNWQTIICLPRPRT